MIPYSRQQIEADDIREVVKALKSPFITQGPRIPEFEEAIARYTGARYAVVFSSGTAALHGAYAISGLKKGNEVITTPLTFAATANMMLAFGAKPVFADVNPHTGNIDPSEVEKKITRKTKAIVPVDYAGFPTDIKALKKIAKKHKLLLIDDAAHALGATYHGKKVGTFADMTMISFHPVKSITTGEGGAILTNNKDFYKKLVMFRSHGLTKDPKKLKNKTHAAWHQEVQLLGFNYRLTDIQAALGISQLKKINRFIQARRRAALRYRSLLSDVPNLILPPEETKNMTSAWHLFVVRIVSKKKGARDRVFASLRKAGIGVQVHYLPVYLHPYYRGLGYKRGLCPEAEHFTEYALSLPLYPSITEKEQRFVVRILKTLVVNI